LLKCLSCKITLTVFVCLCDIVQTASITTFKNILRTYSYSCFSTSQHLMIYTMKLINIISALLFIAQASAHSWVGCTTHDNKDILEWMKVGHFHLLTNGIANVYTTDKCNSIQDHRSTDAMVRRPLPRLAARKAKPRRLGRRNQLLPLGSPRRVRERSARVPPKPAHTFIPPQ
jgi:hypothetical protein